MPRNTHPNSRWNKETDAELRRLWSKGLTAAQIATEMSAGITRNMVIGRANRLKLGARIPGRHTPKPPPPRPQKRPKAKPVTLPALPINRPDIVVDEKSLRPSAFVALPGTKPILLEALGDAPRAGRLGQCRWPIGENPTMFCGCATEKAYCEAHHRRAYHQIDKVSR